MWYNNFSLILNHIFMSKTKIILILLVVAFGLVGTVLAQDYSVVTTSNPAWMNTGPIVTVDQLKAAGFDSVIVQATKNDRFAAPVFYFRTKEAVAEENGAAWMDAASLVSVLIRPMADNTWVYNQGNVEVVEFNGRYQVRLSSPGYYIVVTASDKDKAVTLAHTLKVLY